MKSDAKPLGLLIEDLPLPAQTVLVRLDWRAYYREFALAHGGYPVVHKGRQLFADGWRYSLTDHAGPEWPPPDDPKELLQLRLAYWRRRLTISANAAEVLGRKLRAMEDVQRAKDLPLQQIAASLDPVTGLWRRIEGACGEFDFASHRRRLEDLESDAATCRERLAELEEGKVNDGQTSQQR